METVSERPVLGLRYIMSELPLVSISCITYNHEKYIRDALEGFLIQKTSFPIEILIHDDASTDETVRIIKEYEAKYPDLVKPIYQIENQYSKGVKISATYNFPRARGKYIALCEGDDYWTDPLKLQKQVNFLEANPEYSLCFHNATMIYEDNQESRDFRNIETREYTGEEILKEWTIPTASVVFRKAMYEPLNHPDFMYGDIILFLSLAEKGKLWGSKEIMSIYRRHAGGITLILQRLPGLLLTRKKIRHYRAILKSFNGHYQKTSKDHLSWHYLELSKGQLKHLNPLFLISLIKSFAIAPIKFFRSFIGYILKFNIYKK